MESRIFEYLFLTECYKHNVDENHVYTLFLKKVISDLYFKENKIPLQYFISQLQKIILTEYKIEIPPTLIKTLLRNLPGFGKEIILKKDVIYINAKVPELEENSKQQQKMLDSYSRIVLETFNNFLENNKRNRLSYKDFVALLNTYCNNIIENTVISDYENSKLFIEWVKRIFTSNMEEVQEALNKIIYSWLLYSYFYTVKRSKKKLVGFSIVFDTNLLIYLLGINGEERKNFVIYFLKKMQENNCSVIIDDCTINELVAFLKSPSLDIQQFAQHNSDTLFQLKNNTQPYLEELFRTYDVKVLFENNKLPISEDSFKDLCSSLKSYKNKDDITGNSIEHDIKLIASHKALRKVTSIYTDDKKLIVTTDAHLSKWLSSYVKRHYKSDYSCLLTLDKISLIFWVESDKCDSSDFLMNTWLSISDSIQYFKNHKINDLLKNISVRAKGDNVVPDNWHSVYLLIKENLPNDKDEEDINDDDINNLLDKILTITNSANAEENMVLKKKIADFEKQHSLILQQSVVVQSSQNSDSYSVLELFIMLIKKIIQLFKP